MSTRCNIVVKDNPFGKDRELWFYRHSDGYPSSVLPSLEPLMDKLRKGEVRDNISQFAGWIIVLGHEEYAHYQNDWKVGAYEPTFGLHGDVEYLYTIDLQKKTLTYERFR